MGNVFFERFAELCKKIGETPNSVAKRLGISSGSVTAWKNGTEPRYSTVTKIADFLGTSADYLLGNTSNSLPKPNKIVDLFRGVGGLDLNPDYDVLIVPKGEKAPTVPGERKDVLDEVDVAWYGDYKELDEDQKATVRDMIRVMRERRAKKQE